MTYVCFNVSIRFKNHSRVYPQQTNYLLILYYEIQYNIIYWTFSSHIKMINTRCTEASWDFYRRYCLLCITISQSLVMYFIFHRKFWRCRRFPDFVSTAHSLFDLKHFINDVCYMGNNCPVDYISPRLFMSRIKTIFFLSIIILY